MADTGMFDRNDHCIYDSQETRSTTSPPIKQEIPEGIYDMPSCPPINEKLKLSAITRYTFFPSQPKREDATKIDPEDQSDASNSTIENDFGFESPTTDDETDEEPGKDNPPNPESPVEAHHSDTASEDLEAERAKEAIDAELFEELELRRSHEAVHEKSLTIAELIVSNLELANFTGAKKKKRTFDEYMDDQCKKTRQSLWLIEELQGVLANHSKLVEDQITQRRRRAFH
ncbi:hypothetical protein BKA61DRAFT_55383 [Leptodontidium sp. MPI-SDFR-AT-0119]|nr:hypothetical protein BKA61DRAFT_55383 [Leptodontidium sp. MPI-SDFR-AT-0119]